MTVPQTRTWHTDRPRVLNRSRNAKIIAILHEFIDAPFQNEVHQKVRIKEIAMGIVMLKGRYANDPDRRIERVREILDGHFAIGVRLDEHDMIELFDEKEETLLWKEGDEH